MSLKVLSATFLLVSFFISLKESSVKLGIIFFLFHFKSSFCYQKNQFLEFSDIQVSWQHQMHKHKTKNTFYWINLKVNSVNKFWTVYVILQKKKSYKKLHKNCNLKISSIPVCIRKELKGQPLFQNEPFEGATYIRYIYIYIYICVCVCVCVSYNYQNLSKSADFFRFFFTEDSLKPKKGLELVSTHFS